MPFDNANRFDIYPDTYRRWSKIGSMIPGEGLTVLDVGGDPNNREIGAFLPHRITVANPSYNGISGTALPYSDKAFDVTISIDTLEHVPGPERPAFISELIRTSRIKTIIACPFDEPFVAELERTIHTITNHPMLAEHIKYGLPSLPETLNIIESQGFHYRVQDNDNLLAWASWLLLHQSTGRRVDLRSFNRLLNRIYDPAGDQAPAYRKVIEIFKEHHSKFPIRSFNSNPTVSIVIPAISAYYLDECLNSIETRTLYPEYEIIIVNDGSRESAFLEFIKKTSHKVVSLEENQGFGRANNAGFREARGDYLVTLNADTKVTFGWLKAMVDRLEAAPEVAAVGPIILTKDTDLIDQAGSAWDPKDVRRFTSVYHGKNISDLDNRHISMRVDALAGACLCFRRKPLFEVGLFDEQYYNGWEDMDICLSLLESGYTLERVPSVIRHMMVGFRNRSPEFIRQVKKNQSYFHSKWQGISVVNHRVVKKNRFASDQLTTPNTIPSDDDFPQQWGILFDENRKETVSVSEFYKSVRQSVLSGSEISRRQNNKGKMKVLYVAVHQHVGWGAEYFVNNALMNMDCETICLDFRKHRSGLKERVSDLVKKHDPNIIFLQRGDNLPDDLFEGSEIPTVFWASELVARTDDQSTSIRSKYIDYVFLHSVECLKIVQQLGWRTPDDSGILVNGFDDTIIGSIPSYEKDIDILFVGNIGPRRQAILEALQPHIPIKVVSGVYGRDYYNLLKRAKIVLNIHYTDRLDLETRIFEAMGSEACVVTEKLSEDAAHVGLDKNCLVEIERLEEITERIPYLLSHQEILKEYWHKAKCESKNHTWEKRVQDTILRRFRILKEKSEDVKFDA